MGNSPALWASLAEHVTLAFTLRGLRIRYDPEKCKGIWQCYEVCPVGCWTPDAENRKVIFHDPNQCIACGACVLQGPEGAIELK
jgi:NAD-dependent dihydropyrimidine dehydrogenase PreA subunit